MPDGTPITRAGQIARLEPLLAEGSQLVAANRDMLTWESMSDEIPNEEW
jgi:hypothetical protein